MNWSYRFAFDEIQEMLDNRPWLLVDDDFASANNDDFIPMQKRIYLERGWEWFKNAIRGRLFRKLNLTTLTTWNGENNPDQGDPDPTVIAKVEQEFPGVSIVSLIGSPHVVSGPPVSPDILGRISKMAETQRWKLGLDKKASTKLAANAEKSRPYYKDEFQFEIADVDRYATDKYFANLVLQESDKLYSIGFQMYNYQVGLTGAVQYWHYEKDELDRAKKTFHQIKTALIETMTDIEYHRPPMAVITPMVRSVLQNIDIGRKERSGNYFHNWFEEIVKEPDWRTTIYGNRYPPATIQYIDAFWNADDASKKIVTEGVARNRILRYKQASTQKEADLRQTVTKWINYAKGFGIGVTIGWIGANYTILEQKSAENPQFSPQQVFETVLAENPEAFQPPVSEPSSADLQPEIVENPVKMHENSEFSSQAVDIFILVDRIIQTESSGNPNATSPEGARGLMQIMPKTWQEWSGKVYKEALPFDKAYDPDANRRVGTAYLQWIQNTLRSWMGQEPGVDHILAAYNGGIGRLRQVKFDVSQMPSESREYVQKITIQGVSSSTIHHAFQETELLRLKHLVRNLAQQAYSEQQVGKFLADQGVPRNTISYLIAEVFVSYVSSAYANSAWHHKYAEC